MSKKLKKRVFTSAILLSILIIFNFTKFFMVGVFIAVLFICIEFSELLAKVVGPGLVKHHRYSSYPEKLNFKYLTLQILIIFYVLIIFGGTSMELHGRSGSPVFFLFILSICFFSDIGGYIIGKLIGGKKLTKISPNKTISGSIGSFIFSLIPLLLFNYDLILKNLLFCLLVSFSCQLGDLIISYFKRLNRVKDTGNILPGHGGLLDRFDGIIFAIPTIYILKNYFGIF